MDDDNKRLQFAQWILERNLNWVTAAEAKTGVVVAITTAMLGSLAAAFSALQPDERSAWAYVVTSVAAGLLFSSVFCAAMSVLPRLSGPKSNIFFGQVSKTTASQYVESMQASSLQDLLSDCLSQIHRNAEIASEKFQWIRRSMLCGFFSIPFWVAALGLLVRT